MDISDIIAHISSGVWSERRDGLVSLQMLLKSDMLLSVTDAKKLSEIFTRMFHDPSAKVFGVFLETLPRFVRAHAADVPDWLYVCLSRLLSRMASEQLTSVLGRVSKVLKSVREEFPADDQLVALARFVCESSKMNDVKARTIFLEYVHDLVVSMDSSELSNSDSVQQLTMRIIAWTSEPKCSNIRRLSQNIVIAMFNVNTPEFYTILNALPRSMRDAGYVILQNHLSAVSCDSEPTTSQPNNSSRVLPSADYSNDYRLKKMVDDVENDDQMSTEEFYASLKKAAEDIANLSRMDSLPPHF
jgi:CLIP-associating protein 1/2